MAMRLKTIEYWFPLITSIPDVTKTAATQITVYIPEAASGSINFRSVTVETIIVDAYTSATNVTQRQTFITLQGATETSVNNTNTLTQSAENFSHHISADFTSYFTSNWGSNASRTLDCSLTINGSSQGSTNASVRVVITYDFDDTQSTHIKTVWIPMDADINSLPTSKSGTATDTIPALDTYCPESSKVYRQIVVVQQGNTEVAGTTDRTVSWEIDTAGVFTSGTFEKGSNSDYWYRLNEIVSFDTSTTHNFYAWASGADFDHPQRWLVVTYEFSPGSSSRMLNSLILPMEFGGAMGGPTSSDYQRATRELWVQEPGTITSQRIALYVHYDSSSAIAGLNARVGTGSFITYSDVVSVASGGLGLMLRNDSAFTITRGRNQLTADIYNTDTTDLGYNLASWWIVNYESDIPSQGYWAANHTIIRNLKTVGTGSAAVQSLVSATAPDIPETTWFLTAVGINYVYTSNSSGRADGVHIGAERLASGEGGVVWENVYEGIGGTDPEVGIRQVWAQARAVFRRFRDGSITDADSDRLSFETARRWRVTLGGAAASFDHLDMVFTYHSISYSVSGSITGSNGGIVNLSLHRYSNGEKLMSTTRSGNGTYSFAWFDDTEQVYVDAEEDSTHLGRSASGYAS